MTFTEGVLRLVRGGARIDRAADAVAPARLDAEAAAAAARSDTVEPFDEADLMGQAAGELSPLEPGLGDLQAAVALVEAGLATRVTLSGFPSWPGLLWEAYQLAEAANVVILPTVVRPGGRVDIVIAKATAADG